MSFFGISYGQLDKITAKYEVLKNRAEGEILSIPFIHEEDSLVADFSSLSQIILVRHGEPALKKDGWRTRREAMKFIRDYDSASVYEPAVRPVELRSDDISYMYTSELPRSISTAQFLFAGRKKKSMEEFNEFQRKILSFYDVKMPLNFWLNTSRVLWLLGLNNRGVETYKEAKQRAKKAAQVLQDDASKNGKTLLISHGFLNHFLVKYLRKQGWAEVYNGGKGYLSQRMLVKL
jgi:broad specificity phosphatase PhoE